MVKWLSVEYDYAYQMLHRMLKQSGVVVRPGYLGRYFILLYHFYLLCTPIAKQLIEKIALIRHQ